MAGGVWAFAEQRGGNLRNIALEAVCEGRRLADKLGARVTALLMGYGVEPLAEKLGAYGADDVFLADGEIFARYTPDAYSKVLVDLIAAHKPDIFIIGATSLGRDLAPTVAAKLRTGLMADCVELKIDADGLLEAKRPIYAGKAFLRVKCPEARPQMATIRPNVMPISQPDKSRKPEVIKLNPTVSAQDVRAQVIDLVQEVGGKVDLTEANIIVSGGRGMKGAENFAILESLADAIGAAVGASRAAVDAGWRDHQYQVGQTGKTVSPNLYIACGISGAIQHLAGMSSSKCIIAINKDPEANIFKVADYGIVGDLFQVVPLLTEEFKKLLKEN